MIKMTLKICAHDVKEIREALTVLADPNGWRFNDNEYGEICKGVEFDYYFVNSDDVFSNDEEKPTIDPNPS